MHFNIMKNFDLIAPHAFEEDFGLLSSIKLSLNRGSWRKWLLSESLIRGYFGKMYIFLFFLSFLDFYVRHFEGFPL